MQSNFIFLPSRVLFKDNMTRDGAFGARPAAAGFNLLKLFSIERNELFSLRCEQTRFILSSNPCYLSYVDRRRCPHSLPIAYLAISDPTDRPTDRPRSPLSSSLVEQAKTFDCDVSGRPSLRPSARPTDRIWNNNWAVASPPPLLLPRRKS